MRFSLSCLIPLALSGLDWRNLEHVFDLFDDDNYVEQFGSVCKNLGEEALAKEDILILFLFFNQDLDRLLDQRVLLLFFSIAI